VITFYRHSNPSINTLIHPSLTPYSLSLFELISSNIIISIQNSRYNLFSICTPFPYIPPPYNSLARLSMPIFTSSEFPFCCASATPFSISYGRNNPWTKPQDQPYHKAEVLMGLELTAPSNPQTTAKLLKYSSSRPSKRVRPTLRNCDWYWWYELKCDDWIVG
jgi:hypothetical protein